jgi:hypothetical protein
MVTCSSIGPFQAKAPADYQQQTTFVNRAIGGGEATAVAIEMI